MADELICDCRTRLDSGFGLEARFRLPLEHAPLTVLFGPSGAGKTTLLRLLAGLDRPREGTIEFRGAAWFDARRGICLAPQQRRAGYVAQSPSLFPHLTVGENIAYAARDGTAGRYLEEFGLSALAGRYPREISSGQRQRVALARALAASPALLLLDEPLAALDAAARVATRRQLSQILVASGIPSIFVTHDHAEAIALGDWVAVMTEGLVARFGPVEAIPLGGAAGECENVLAARVSGRGGGLLRLETGAGELQALDGGESGALRAAIRAADIALTREPAQASSARNRMAGRIVSVEIEGPLARVRLDCGVPLVALITAQSARELELKAGDAVTAVIKTTAIQVLA